MKILILTQYFDPEPTLKGLAFAKALSDKGHKVEVLTGFPNYPGGKIYSGFKMKLWTHESIDSVKVSRVALYPSHDRSVVRRLWNYLSFSLASSIFGPWLISRPEIIYVYSPPLTISIPAIVLKAVTGCPIVIDIQDLWPDALGSTGMVKSDVIIRLVSWWAKAFYWAADQVVVLSPGFREKLIGRGVPESKVHVVYNWNEESRQKNSAADFVFGEKWGLTNRLNIMYAGSMGPAQALGTC